MKIHGSRKQRGVVILLVTMVLPVLLLAAGFALDFGHIFVNKTRLQNALDATALSAAIAINSDATKDTAAATAKGIATFNLFIAASGNSELAGLNPGSLVFEYAKTVNPWVSFNANTDPFVFVKVTSTNMLQVTPVLIRILNQLSTDIPVPAVATAGPVGLNCDWAPLAVCPQSGTPIGCDATGCNGVPYQTRVCLKAGTGAKKSNNCDQDNHLASGEFGLVAFDGNNGNNAIKARMEGTDTTCPTSYALAKGNKVDTTSAINTRFEADLVQTPYPTVLAGVIGYPQYIAATATALEKNLPGTAYKRVLSVPVVDDCSGKKNKLNIIAVSCFLVTEMTTHKGTTDEIVGELISVCPPGRLNPLNSVLYGPYKIVLFKSPGSGDS